MFYFNEHIYYVKGAVGSTIYNSLTGDIYHLDKEACRLIEQITSSEIELSFDQKNFIGEMVSLGLLTTQYKELKNIHDLATGNSIDFVWIEITTGCNLKCIHCYDEAGAYSIKNMNYEDFCYIIDQLIMLWSSIFVTL